MELFIRKVKVRPKSVNINDKDLEKDYLELLAGHTDLPKEYAKKEISKKVRKIVYELPVKYREVLVLRYLEDKSYTEISDILKRSVNSVSVLVNRAKKLFKEKIITLAI